MKIKGFFTAALLAVLLTGCGGTETKTIILDGSTAMTSVMAVLQEAFREKQPDIQINCSGSGSGAGIEGVLAGTCDIGLSSRALTPEETQRGAVGRVIAWEEIAVVVHPDNPVQTLSPETLVGIFTGKFLRWSELGGEDAPIAVYGREAGSGTRDAFEESLGIVDQCAYRNEYCSAGDVLGNTAGNPNAIGYASRTALNASVSAIPLDQPVQRPFLLVLRKDSPLRPEAAAFLAFAGSSEAVPYLRLAGVVPAIREDLP